MKQLKNWIVIVLFPVLVLLVPELVSVDIITEALLTVTGLAWINVVLVEAIKRLIKYDPLTAWKYLAQFIALVTGFLVSLGAFYLGLGMFSELAIEIQWWGAGFIGIITAGYSMGWYDLELVRTIVKIALGIEIKTLKQ